MKKFSNTKGELKTVAYKKECNFVEIYNFNCCLLTLKSNNSSSTGQKMKRKV